MLLGRFSGLIRDLAVIAHLGLTGDADLAVLAISIPDLLTGLLIGGAVSAVFVPEFHRQRLHESDSAGHQLVGQTLLAMGLVSVALAVLLALFGSWLVALLAPGFEGARAIRAIQIVRITLVAFPCCTLAAVTAAALQAKERVATAAFGTLICNVCVIVGVLCISRSEAMSLLAVAVIVGAALRLVSQLVACRRARLFTGALVGLFSFSRLNRKLFVRYVHTLTAIGLTILLPVISRRYASHFEGGIAGFTFAYKLVELPLGFCSAILTMVYFPRISAFFTAGQTRQAERLVSRLAGWVLVASVPMVVCMTGAAQAMIGLLFQHGELGADGVQRIAGLARIAFAALPALILTQLAMSVFHARQSTGFPFVVTIVLAMIHAAVSSLAAAHWGEAGLMIALVAVAWMQCLVLVGGLFWRHRIALWAGVSPGVTGLLVLPGIAGIAGCLALGTRIGNPYIQAVVGLLICLACLGLNVAVIGRRLWQPMA
jgi:putative peptidoglycan lipid II flippase